MASNRVFVTGLPSETTVDELTDFFSRIGEVSGVAPEPQASGSAVFAIDFETAADAAAALTVSGSDFRDNMPISIVAQSPAAAPAAVVAAAEEPSANAASPDAAAAAAAAPARDDRHERRSDRRRDDAKDTRNKVVVTNTRGISRSDMRDALEKCGPIDDFFYMTAAGRAIIGFTTVEGYEKALQLDGTQVAGVTITVKPRVVGEESERGRGRNEAAIVDLQKRRVIVENIRQNMPREALREFFAVDCGNPSEIYIRQKTLEAFVEFPTHEAVEKALAKSGQTLCGNVIQIKRRPIVGCYACGRDGHKSSNCPERSGSRHGERGGHRRGGGGGDRRRRRSSSSDRDYRSRRRRDRSDSPDRHRRRRHSRSRSPPRRRRHSRSRSPPRRRR